MRASSNLNTFYLQQEVQEFLSILTFTKMSFGQVLEVLEEIDYLEKKASSQSKHQNNIMETSEQWSDFQEI